MMIEALSMAQDQSMEPQSPALTIQNLLGNLEPESAHIYVAEEGRRWQSRRQIKSNITKASRCRSKS